jgi:cytochrome P450
LRSAQVATFVLVRRSREGEIAFATLLRDVPGFAIAAEPVVWRNNTGLSGLSSLPITFGRSSGN